MSTNDAAQDTAAGTTGLPRPSAKHMTGKGRRRIAGLISALKGSRGNDDPINDWAFTPTQLAQFDRAIDAIREAQDGGQRLLIVITGAQGTAKSTLSMALLGWYLDEEHTDPGAGRSRTTLYLQGQTKDRIAQVLPSWVHDAGQRSTIATWDGDPSKYASDLAVFDEAHLAPPLGWAPLAWPRHGAGPGNAAGRRVAASRWFHNKGSFEPRKLKVRGEYVPTIEDQASWKGGYEPLLAQIAAATSQVLIIVRDPDQVHDPLAMLEEEFDDSIGQLLDSGWHGPLKIELTEQHRTPAAWGTFLADLFRPGIIDLNDLAAKYGRHISNGSFNDEVSYSHLPFQSHFYSDLLTMTNDLKVQQKRSDSFRMLATFSWEYKGPFAVDHRSFHWAADGLTEPGRGNALAKWPFKSDYDWAHDGVGYIKSCQNQEFDAIGVLIGPHLRWRPQGSADAVGQWELTSPQDWRPYVNSRAFVRSADLAYPEGSDDVELLRRVLNEARVLVGRGRRSCGVYFVDPAARAAISTLGATRKGEY